MEVGLIALVFHQYQEVMLLTKQLVSLYSFEADWIWGVYQTTLPERPHRSTLRDHQPARVSTNHKLLHHQPMRLQMANVY